MKWTPGPRGLPEAPGAKKAAAVAKKYNNASLAPKGGVFLKMFSTDMLSFLSILLLVESALALVVPEALHPLHYSILVHAHEE